MSIPDILTTLEFQMTLLLFVALGGYLIAYRINQSAVIGIILAGILVGPSVLGLITYTDFVASLGHLGAIVLLFTIGLHFSIKDILNIKFLFIALLGIIVPWISGFYIARLFSFNFGASIFIGTALTATSIAITANVLKEMNKLHTKAAKAIIGAAIIDDILSLLALSISEGIVSGEISVVSTLIVIAKAVGFIIIAILVGNLAVTRIIARLDKTRFCCKFPETLFIFAIMVAFLYGMAANLVGLSAIIGSFLAGVALGQVEFERCKVFREGADYLQIVFASIFFVSLGVLLDWRVINLSLVWFIIVLTIIAMASKFIGCGVPAKLVGMNVKDSLVIGLGMAPRGEVAMIVALIGLNKSLIAQDVYSTLVLMSLLTTIATPLILRNLIYRQKTERLSQA